MFQFKEFRVNDERCAMKIGTDGVLLGAWANVNSAKRMLDVGTGSGLISLMMAQRNGKARITGIDIDADAVSQAKENVDCSPWRDRIEVMKVDFNNPVELNGMKFDLIVSNPPFYTADTRSEDAQRATARNASALPLPQLMKNAERLLAADGVFSIVIPSEEASFVIGEAALNTLFLMRKCEVRSRVSTSPKRTLLEFSRNIVPTEQSEMVIYGEDDEYTEEFMELTKGFYLKVERRETRVECR